MDRKLIVTADGSHSILVPEMNVTYHSVHGAIQESMHVFIESGFKHLLNQSTNKPINILEVGFGTGLNVLLTIIAAEKLDQNFYYVAIEPNPLSLEEARSLNYCELLGRKDLEENFMSMHQCEWNKSLVVSENMMIYKSNHQLQTFNHFPVFNLIYFDAFDPKVQPELWTKEIFEKMFELLRPGGILVTYSSKGEVRRAMQAAGFEVEKLPGARGKREMIRGRKVIKVI